VHRLSDVLLHRPKDDAVGALPGALQLGANVKIRTLANLKNGEFKRRCVAAGDYKNNERQKTRATFYS
jgi:hypothetical protein